jgi:hypothetical protein
MRFDTHLERTTKMKNLFIFCAAALLVASMFSVVSAGEFAGAVPATTLSSMGFGGVELMSDDAGQAVRGKGSFAAVWGSSSANYNNHNGDNTSSNNYVAGAHNRRGGSSAVGGSLSFAGSAYIGGHHSSVKVNFAGGGAFAHAH